MKRLLVLLTLFITQSLVYADNLSGSLSGTLSADTYIITDHISVQSGETLTLEPEVFLFNDGLAFEIFGTVNAIGTEQNNIVFTIIRNGWYIYDWGISYYTFFNIKC